MPLPDTDPDIGTAADHESGSAFDFTPAEASLARGIGLMVLLKVGAIGWLGLDADAWYVWPWSWVAFALMVPWLVELVNECQDEEVY